jgi:hypothetical protein
LTNRPQMVYLLADRSSFPIGLLLGVQRTRGS